MPRVRIFQRKLIFNVNTNIQALFVHSNTGIFLYIFVLMNCFGLSLTFYGQFGNLSLKTVPLLYHPLFPQISLPSLSIITTHLFWYVRFHTHFTHKKVIDLILFSLDSIFHFWDSVVLSICLGVGSGTLHKCLGVGSGSLHKCLRVGHLSTACMSWSEWDHVLLCMFIGVGFRSTALMPWSRISNQNTYSTFSLSIS